MLDRQCVRIHAIHTADIDHHRRCAVPVLAAGEGFDAAGGTNEVGNLLLIEAVLCQILLTFEQPELPGGNEVEKEALPGAMRTIALDRLADVCVGLKSDCGAMASACVGFHSRTNLKSFRRDLAYRAIDREASERWWARPVPAASREAVRPDKKMSRRAHDEERSDEEWARLDSNQRPDRYERPALTN